MNKKINELFGDSERIWHNHDLLKMKYSTQNYFTDSIVSVYDFLSCYKVKSVVWPGLNWLFLYHSLVVKGEWIRLFWGWDQKSYSMFIWKQQVIHIVLDLFLEFNIIWLHSLQRTELFKSKISLMKISP